MTELIRPFAAAIIRAETLFDRDETQLSAHVRLDTFSDTTLGRGGIGGQMLTNALTTAIHDPFLELLAVYRNGALDYVTDTRHDSFRESNNALRLQQCCWPPYTGRHSIPLVHAHAAIINRASIQPQPQADPPCPPIKTFARAAVDAQSIFRAHEGFLEPRMRSINGSITVAIQDHRYPFVAVYHDGSRSYIVRLDEQGIAAPHISALWHNCSWPTNPDSLETATPDELTRTMERLRNESIARRRRLAAHPPEATKPPIPVPQQSR